MVVISSSNGPEAMKLASTSSMEVCAHRWERSSAVDHSSSDKQLDPGKSFRSAHDGYLQRISYLLLETRFVWRESRAFQPSRLFISRQTPILNRSVKYSREQFSTSPSESLKDSN